jgi:hypothetical protein
MNFTQDYTLRNIKHHQSWFQIQYIVNGTSHSRYAGTLKKAIIIRDQMEKRLDIIPNGDFRKYVQKNKRSFIPGTDQLMEPGIGLTVHKRKHGVSVIYIRVKWKDYAGVKRDKGFYCGTENTCTLGRLKRSYKRALKFRQAYEQAVLDKTLVDFDPSVFNLKAV